MSDDKQPADDLDPRRPYPEGVAFDEAWRQRQRADAMEAVNADMYRIIKRFADRIEQLQAKSIGVLEWYHRDGSVGGACDPMEELRSVVGVTEEWLSRR